MHLLKIKAPEVAQYAKPGQFVILMAKETSERAPFTLADWNAEEGSITVVIEEVGRSSRELISLKQGSRKSPTSAVLSGCPFPIEKKGTVVLGGGCYGIGAIYPIARALKEAGNEVVCVIEGCNETPALHGKRNAFGVRRASCSHQGRQPRNSRRCSGNFHGPHRSRAKRLITSWPSDARS